MHKPRFTVPVADLEQGPKQVRWELSSEWLEQALEETEARPRRAGSLVADLTMNGRQVLVRGRIGVQLTMPCVRTLDPVEVDLEPELFLLLDPPTPPAGPTRKRSGRPGAPQTSDPHRGRHLMDATSDTKGWERDPTLERDNAAHDSYDGEQVVLDGFVREFIVLELPMSPRRSDLPSESDAATTPALRDPGSASGPSVDPRLAPLVEIANRMRKTKE